MCFCAGRYEKCFGHFDTPQIRLRLEKLFIPLLHLPATGGSLKLERDSRDYALQETLHARDNFVRLNWSKFVLSPQNKIQEIRTSWKYFCCGAQFA